MEHWNRKTAAVFEINTFKIYHWMKLQTVDVEKEYKDDKILLQIHGNQVKDHKKNCFFFKLRSLILKPE